MTLENLQSALFVLMNAAGFLFPVSAPYLAAVEAIIHSLESQGIVTDPTMKDKLTALQSGCAASEASAVTTYIEHHKVKP